MAFKFYATEDDLIAIFRWMDGTGNFQFLEVYSRQDMDNRVYESFPEREWKGDGHLHHVTVWPVHAGSPPQKKPIIFKQNRMADLLGIDIRRDLKGRGRTILESPAFIRFNRVANPAASYVPYTEMLFETEYSVDKMDRFSRDQIRQLSFVELNKAIAAIKKQVKFMAVAKWRTMPVMAGVADLCRTQGARLWDWGKEGTI